MEYSGSIYDEILKSIAECKFVIADLTFGNNGVYYETGYARGIGKEVIYTCSQAWFNKKKVHFDVSGFNIVLYENFDDLKRKLKPRVDSMFNKLGLCNEP